MTAAERKAGINEVVRDWLLRTSPEEESMIGNFSKTVTFKELARRTTPCGMGNNGILGDMQTFCTPLYCVIADRNEIQICLGKLAVAPLAVCQLRHLATTLLVAGKNLHQLQALRLGNCLRQRLRHISATNNYYFHKFKMKN